MKRFAETIDKGGSMYEALEAIAMNRQKQRGKLETKVLKTRPIRDGQRRYIPYCDFGYHQGVSKTYEICEERRCKHYFRLYIPHGIH